jgi:hypothetical protein
MAFISFQRISIIKTKLLLLDLQVRWGRKREKKEKEAKETKEGGGQMHQQKKKTIVTWEYTIYLQGNLFCVLETKYLNYQKKKKSN